MSGKSAIEWTDCTWNVIVGCTQVSPGCERCYAKTLHDRRHAIYARHDGRWAKGGNPMPEQYAFPFEQVQVLASRLDMPFHWRTPRRIFVNSVSDAFPPDIPDETIFALFSTMLKASWHQYQILTKRPSRAVLLVPKLLDLMGGRWPAHILIGVSVESPAYLWRVDKHRQLPAPHRFISAEPLLADITFDLTGISWLITGAESGVGARPMEDEWVRHLRDQCLASKTTFFFKQRATSTGKKLSLPELDGVIWNQMPPILQEGTHA
jgi:protein gp37